MGFHNTLFFQFLLAKEQHFVFKQRILKFKTNRSGAMNKYSHKYPIVFWLTVMVFIICNTALAIDVEYIFTIDNPSSGQGKIKMTIDNLSSNTLSIMPLKTYDPRWGVNVITIEAKDKDGNSLNLNSLPYNNSIKWTVDTTGLNKCIIEYTVEPKAYDAPEYGTGYKYYHGYISQDFAVSSTAYIFLIPVDVDTSPPIEPNSMKISFKVPQGWQIITPWPQENGVYYPLSIPSIDWNDLFGNGIFGLGNFDLHNKKIGNAEVIVAFYGTWSNEFKEDITQNIWDIYSYQTSVWKDSLEYRYLVIYSPDSVNGDLITGALGELGQQLPLNEDPSFINWSDFSHEMCECRWISMDWVYVGPPSLWAQGGFSQYYGHKSVIKTRIYTSQWAMADFSSIYDDYKQLVKEGKDLPLASQEADTDYSLALTKGTLVSFLLSKEIYLRTFGNLTFDNLNRLLFQKYWLKGSYIDEEVIKLELENLTGLDFTQFFNDYIYGIKQLPLDWAFQDDDSDGLPNAVEIFWDTNPNRVDTDSDGYSDSGEVNAGTDPSDRRSCPGPCPVISMPWIPLLLLDD
jgi:hypothetical protein